MCNFFLFSTFSITLYCDTARRVQILVFAVPCIHLGSAINHDHDFQLLMYVSYTFQVSNGLSIRITSPFVALLRADTTSTHLAPINQFAFCGNKYLIENIQSFSKNNFYPKRTFSSNVKSVQGLILSNRMPFPQCIEIKICL